MHLLVCYLNIIGKFTRADIYDSYVEEKQPVISLTGDPFDFWSTTTLSEAEKVGFKSLFLFVGLFFSGKGRSKRTGRSDTPSKLPYTMPGADFRFVNTNSYNTSTANSHYL